MAKVAFVSHASEEAAIVASITDYLERNGVTSHDFGSYAPSIRFQ
jgi:hypothetical protein